MYWSAKYSKYPLHSTDNFIIFQLNIRGIKLKGYFQNAKIIKNYTPFTHLSVSLCIGR